MNVHTLKANLLGKTISNVEFIGGVCSTCNFVKSLSFTDGTLLEVTPVYDSEGYLVRFWWATIIVDKVGDIRDHLRVFGEIKESDK